MPLSLPPKFLAMISIGNSIISEEVITKKFCCNLLACKGECCVEGDSGAPLQTEEVGIIEANIEAIKPFMRAEGIEAVEQEGVFEVDEDGDLVTTLVKGAECAFVYFEKGMALCAIEKAYKEGKTNFYKPISCHLYPIRITKYSDFEAVNYHKWSVCADAVVKGNQKGIEVYKFLKEPLIRYYGKEWYAQLETEIASGRYNELLDR